MKTILKTPKEKQMNCTFIDYYMKKHDFLTCDKQKIKNFIDTEKNYVW